MNLNTKNSKTVEEKCLRMENEKTSEHLDGFPEELRHDCRSKNRKMRIIHFLYEDKMDLDRWIKAYLVRAVNLCLILRRRI